MLARVTAATALTLLVACAPPAPAPTRPPQPAAKTVEAKPAAPAAKTAEKPPAKAVAAWEQEWERVLSAARQEGKVAITGPQGVDARDSLTDPFTKRFGIPVEFFGGSGRDISPRVINERAAGQYTWDVYVSGTSTGLGDFIPMGFFERLEPALILPDVKDPNSWRGGALEFADEGRQLMVMTPFHTAKLMLNPSLVNPEELKSFKQLLDPKWKGKLLSDDPRSPGGGQAAFLFFYLHPELGPEFIRALAEQELTLLRDHRQEMDLIGRGHNPIIIGPPDAAAQPLIKQGVPLHLVDPRQMRELSDVTPANGAVALYERAPHPNAARVYVNWLLSKEGQTEFVRAQGSISARLDVPTDHASAWRVPQAGAIQTYTLEAQKVKDEKLLPLLREVLGSQ